MVGCLMLANILLIVLPLSTAAQELLNGDEIARRVNARAEGDTVSRMVTIESVLRGGVRREVLRGFRKRSLTDTKTVLFYQSPANIRGTAFLTIDYAEPGKDDDQWLYLPADRRVRRISAAERGGSFQRTAFSYEDLKNEAKLNIDDYRRITLRKEAVDGHDCFVVEAIPVNEQIKRELRYGRVHVWVDAEIWVPRQFEIWDQAGSPLKTVRFKDIRQVQGVWTVHTIEGVRRDDGLKTVFTFTDVDYLSPVKEDLFTPNALERGQ